MRSALTDQKVRSTTPKAKPYEVLDTKQPGLILRVQPSGVKSYVLQWARGKRRTLGNAKQETLAWARNLARQGLSEAHEFGAPRLNAEAPAGTLGDFLDEHYALWIREHRKTADATLAILNAEFKDFRKHLLADISVGLVERYRTQALARGLAGKSANNYVQTLKGVLSKAVEWDRLDRNPLAKLKPLKLDKRGVVRFLSPEEEGRIREALAARDSRLREARVNYNTWRAARHEQPYPEIPPDGFGDHLTPMVLVSLNSGVRFGELSNLLWRDVNFRTRTLTVVASSAKSGQTRHVPLNFECEDVLKRWRKQSGELGLAFKGEEPGTRIKSAKKAWQNLLAEAEVEAFRWHDLRHTFASKLVMAGVDLNTVRELLGHGDLAMTLRYAHLAADHKAAAVAKLGGVA